MDAQPPLHPVVLDSAFVTGILLVIDSDFWGFGDDWIVIGLALFAVTFLAGIFFGPESGRLASC